MNIRSTTIWRKLAITTMIIGAVLVLAKVTETKAQIPALLNFAGKVTNVDGSELADGTYDFSFGIYTQATGGAAAWSENLTAATCFNGTISGVTENADNIVYNYTGGSATTTLRLGQYLTRSPGTENALIIDYDQGAGTITVASGSSVWSIGDTVNNRPYVEGGVININLGSVSDLSNLNFNQTLYLEVTFNGETMQPRKILVPGASAFQASRIGDKTESELAGLGDNESVTGEWSFNNILTIASSSSLSALTITQDGSGNIAEFKYGTTTALAVLSDGRVSIGDYTFPANRSGSAAGYVLKIDAGGNMYWSNDLTTSGSGGSLWSTSSNDLYIYPLDSADIVVIGGNATTTTEIGYYLQVDGGTWLENLAISAQNQIRFYDADSSNYIALRASSTLAGNFVLTLPDDDGLLGQALTTDGNGNLSWSSSVTRTDEEIRDVAGPLVASGTANSLISIFYNDATDAVDFTVNSDLSQYNNSIAAFWSTSTGALPVGYGGIGTTTFQANSLIYASANNVISEILPGGNGKVLKIIGGVPGWGDDLTSSGGFGAAAGWSTSTDNLLIYTTNNALSQPYTVVIGGSGTTTSGYQFEVIGNSLFDGITATGLSLTTDLAVSEGGTGRSSWTQYDIVYADTTSSLSQVTRGNPGYLLMVDATGNGYTWISSSTAGVDTWRTDEEIRDVAGPLVASGTANSLISIFYNDATDAVDFMVNSDLSQYNNTVSQFWSTTTYATLATLYGGLGANATAAGAGELLYSSAANAYSHLAAGTAGEILMSTGTGAPDWVSTSTFIIDNDFTSNGLMVRTGSGIYTSSSTLSMVYGGTGLSNISDQSLLYASSDNVIGQFTIGNNGEVLSVVGGQLQWSSTTAPVAHGILSVYHNDAKATSTLVRGDLLLVDSDAEWSRLVLGPAGYIFYSNGTDAMWSTTTAITALGAITVGTWLADTIDIAYGGTGATTAAGARENLNMDEIYEFGINSTGTVGWLWQSDGNGRGQWVATGTLGIDGGSGGQTGKFIGTTTFTTDGSIATSTYVGYQAANYQCAYEFAGSFMCRTHEILQTIEQDDISIWGNDVSSAWIAEGPPGYTWDSNDCNGWRENGATQLGAFWLFNSNGGGAGWLVNCTIIKSIACCSWQ